ncbi:MAG: hypothetical protein A3F16_07750 [Deltaproteobacteria bacterium RIFCSPHIGHO2_12_FULL_43_9]|nr:MAG: hypothetical protein A3F16_07750 [Deltaproteobacteria bacterium RIFCSPHIGHO2_12_FULL_43_9]
MKSKLQKWGNSLAIRIPKTLSEEINVGRGSEVKLEVVDKKIIIEVVKETTYTLQNLLDCVNKDNIHSEIETGKPKGKELW